jgi:hypothetical protein
LPDSITFISFRNTEAICGSFYDPFHVWSQAFGHERKKESQTTLEQDYRR